MRDRSKRDSSAAQADSFAGANEKKKRRLASVAMTGQGLTLCGVDARGFDDYQSDNYGAAVVDSFPDTVDTGCTPFQI